MWAVRSRRSNDGWLRTRRVLFPAFRHASCWCWCWCWWYSGRYLCIIGGGWDCATKYSRTLYNHSHRPGKLYLRKGLYAWLWLLPLTYLGTRGKWHLVMSSWPLKWSAKIDSSTFSDLLGWPRNWFSRNDSCFSYMHITSYIQLCAVALNYQVGEFWSRPSITIHRGASLVKQQSSWLIHRLDKTYMWNKRHQYLWIQTLIQ